jgi:hypothetical protein
MRVFVAGASGVIGVRLVPLLVAAGHAVAGMTRSPRKVETLRDLGAEPVVCDAFDAGALRAVVVGFQPEAVVNELTDLPDKPAAISEGNARMRREGTRNLLDAAKDGGSVALHRAERRLAAIGRRWRRRQRTRTASARGRRRCSPVRTALWAGHLLRRREARAAARSRRRGRSPHRGCT